MPASPRLAVFMRTYVWSSSFARHAAARLCALSQGADFFVLADETRDGKSVPAPFQKVGHKAADFAALYLPAVAHRGEMLWWNCDYGLYDACLKCPGYDYYFLVEDDVAVNLPLLPIAARMAELGLDCITFGGSRPIDRSWIHTAWCSDMPYTRKTWTPITVMFISAKAARFLFAERQRLGRLFESGRMRTWPFCEAFCSSALLEGGYRMGDLRDFVITTHFGANSTYLETDERVRLPGSMAHAVLDREHFGPKFFGRTLESLLRTGDYARLAEARADLRQAGFATFEGYRVLPDQGNLALDKPATQSSVSKWSRPPAHHTLDPAAIDARGGNCGILTGGHGFHTDGQDHPWWEVDLEQVQEIGEVRLYNGSTVPGRARHLSVHVSVDGVNWTPVYRKTDGRVFCGNDAPQVCRLPKPVRARHVRVVLDATGPLHLGEIAVYGPRPSRKMADGRRGAGAGAASPRTRR